MSLKTLIIAAGGAALALGLAAAAPAQDPAPDGGMLFENRCKFCHEGAGGGAPERAHLAALPQAKIVEVLTHGAMADMAADLSPEQIAAIATYLTTPATPAAPATDAPAAPATDVPAAPAAEVPTAPTTEVPATPSSETPAVTPEAPAVTPETPAVTSEPEG